MATAIKNVRVFDGISAAENQTVMFEGGCLTETDTVDQIIDGTGCTLLPGLIDSHVHLYEDVKYLRMAAACGITTMLDMGIRNPEAVDGKRNLPGLPGVFSSCGLIFAPGSKAFKMMDYPERMAVRSVEDAERIVEEHVRWGADYIKLILEEEGRNDGVDFPADVGRAVVEQAHKRKKRVIAHAVTNKTYQTGLTIGVDVLTHVPFTSPLQEGLEREIAAGGTVVVPTLIMGKSLMDKIAKAHPLLVKVKNGIERLKNGRAAFRFSIDMACASLSRMRKAGVLILAGTDSNMDDPTTPASVPYGRALQEELELLTGAGMTPAEALQSATSAPAEYFGFSDRGRIAPGLRADLLLVEGNPVENIADIRKVKKVWIKGEEAKI